MSVSDSRSPTLCSEVSPDSTVHSVQRHANFELRLSGKAVLQPVDTLPMMS